ncbi:integrase [Amycolatopsis anabasis]|uniref:integrase n=1 Tax=Amycolatopsis anabasis TaxID=1840409 RepID=UPI001FE6159B|nr:integrase [Amycolatopsis anabasis]
MDFYTGGRWGELVGQQRHEYDSERRAIEIRAPLKEIGGRLLKGGRSADAPGGGGGNLVPPSLRRRGRRKGRTKTPSGTRSVELPPSIAVFYEELLDSHRYPFVLCTPEGRPWRRSNFRQRHWRPAWDGVHSDDPSSEDHIPAILPWFTFHEGRHSHATWLAEDGIPEVARRARLGQKMKGIGRVYDHVTPAMLRQIIEVLETRWMASLAALTDVERAKLATWFPHLRDAYTRLRIERAPKIIAISSPFDD